MSKSFKEHWEALCLRNPDIVSGHPINITAAKLRLVLEQAYREGHAEGKSQRQHTNPFPWLNPGEN